MSMEFVLSNTNEREPPVPLDEVSASAVNEREEELSESLIDLIVNFTGDPEAADCTDA